MVTTDIAVIGAGPYGLAVAAHLRRAGVDHRLIGQPMSFWHTMPEGMLLRSNWTATCIGEYEGELSLDSFVRATGVPLTKPIPLDRSSSTANGWASKSHRTSTGARSSRCRRPTMAFGCGCSTVSR